MKLRLMLPVVMLASLLMIPSLSPGHTNALYKATGTLSVHPKGAGYSGSWSMTGTLRLTHEVGSTPATGTLRASGPLGYPMHRKGADTLNVTSGGVSISWSDGTSSYGLVEHFMNHPMHTLVVRFDDGYKKGTVAVLIVLHKPNNKYTGYFEFSPVSVPPVSVFGLLCELSPSRPTCDA
jgi:hypothetical protein